jgi:uncharacterized membrane protein HdeD (DUF308 family)
MNKTYNKLMESISYAAVGSFLVYYAALTVYALNIVVGWIFIAFGFVKAITAPMKEPPAWVNRMDYPMSIALVLGAIAFIITVGVRDVVTIQPLFIVIIVFVLLLAVVQTIGFIRNR